MPVAVSKAQKSSETREAILAACLQRFARHGFAATSMDEIAAAAGITKGAVYWHFTGKEDLFQAILERIRTRWHEVVLRPVTAEGSAAARLDRLFDRYLEFFTEAPERCLFMQRILLEGDSVFASQVARIFRQTARFISRILADGQAAGDFHAGIHPLLAAHGILGSLSGATQQSLANRSLGLQALIQEVRTATLARVAARPSPKRISSK